MFAIFWRFAGYFLEVFGEHVRCFWCSTFWSEKWHPLLKP